MKFPEDLKYTKDHEWVRVEGDAATIGITEFAQSELGDIVFVEPAQVGKTLQQGDQLCVLESTKAASDVYAPVGGTVKEANPALSQKPELINSSPYQEGWIARLSSLVSSDFSKLMSAKEYEAYLGGKTTA